MSKISVVIPVCNEEGVVAELAQRVAKVLRDLKRPFEVIFVDDGSSDRTLTILLSEKQKIPELKIVELSRNFGQTAALAAGMDASCGEVVITMDGDLQHDPQEIPKFLEKIEQGYDLVSGRREGRKDNLLLRRIPSKAANTMMRWLSNISFEDFGSTYKAYRSEVLKKLELFGELHRFIPALAGRVGARMVEIPVTVAPRVRGKSHYSLLRIFGVFEDLIFLVFYLRSLTRPIRAFGGLFFIFFGSGFVISAVLMLLWFLGVIAAVSQHAALLLFSVFLMVIGVQFLGIGVLAEILSRIYHHTSKTRIYSIRKIHGS